MSESNKAFQVVDQQKGIFSLYDKVFGVHRLWKVDSQASPGLFLAQEMIDSGVKKFAGLLNGSDQKSLTEKVKALSAEERKEYYEAIKKTSHKRLAAMCMYVEPVDEDVPYAGMWENKMEFLAACLSHQDDSMKISDFFLTHLGDSMQSQEENAPLDSSTPKSEESS